MNQQGFRHNGEVISLEQGDVINISLRAIEACDGCRAKSVCSASNGKDESGSTRVMRVVSSCASSLKVGDMVDVSITYKIGMMAVIVAYIIPLIVFVGSLAVGVSVGLEEGVAALVTFAITAIYYGVVYLLRENFERVVHFEVIKLE
ncbi:MAG: SoxR reducing system RseC family protein [Rikenellaceae bacterium]